MLELIAIISMIIDHIGRAFFPDIIILRILGRISFPIYGYLLLNGIKHTKNIKLYFFRVLAVALISQTIYSSLFDSIQLNICFSLALSILALKIIISENYKILTKSFVVIGSIFISMLLGFEYGAYGIIMIILFSIKRIPILIFAELFWNILSIFLFNFLWYQVFAFLGIILFVIIGNKRKNNIYKIIPRGFNYLIYPAHLFILLLFKIYWR